MPLIIMRPRPTAALLQRESGLCAIKGLNLKLLIDTENQGMLGGIQIEPHHVVEFLKEVRVLTEFERPYQMGFEPMGFPDALHQGGVGPEVLGQGAERPLGGRTRQDLRGGGHNASDKGLRGRPPRGASWVMPARR